MPEPAEWAEYTPREREIKRIAKALHDLCQPLTTLQCKLEMAEVVGTADGHRQAVTAGLIECARMVVAVASMRQALRAAMQQGTEEQTGAAG